MTTPVESLPSLCDILGQTLTEDSPLRPLASAPPTSQITLDALVEEMDYEWAQQRSRNALAPALALMTGLTGFGEDFPPSLDGALDRAKDVAVRHLDKVQVGRTMASLYEALEVLPAPRREWLRRRVLHRCLIKALSLHDELFDTICGPLRARVIAEALGLMDAAVKAGEHHVSLDIVEGHRCKLDQLALGLRSWTAGAYKVDDATRRVVYEIVEETFARLGQWALQAGGLIISSNSQCEPVSLLTEVERVAILKALAEAPFDKGFIARCQSAEAIELYVQNFATFLKIHRSFAPIPDDPVWCETLLSLLPDCEPRVQERIASMLFYAERASLDISRMMRVLASLSPEAWRHAALRLFGLPFDVAWPCFQSAWGDANEAQRVAMARLLAHWGLHRGGRDTVTAFIEQENASVVVREALEAARERINPDWNALAPLMGRWLEGDAVFENPTRRREVMAWRGFVQSFNNIYLPGAWQALGFEPLFLLHWMVVKGFQGLPFDAEMARALVMHQPVKHIERLYKDGCAKAVMDKACHLRMLEHGAAQKLAGRMLGQFGEEAVDDLLPLLEARKAAVRTAAATALMIAGSPRAVAPLRAALKKDRSSKVKEALQRALERCDARLKASAQEMKGGWGVYKLGSPFETSWGVEQLRAILYEAPTHDSWVRLCDLLERFRQAGALMLALDYLGDGQVDRWPEEMRALPWGWREGEDALRVLGTQHEPRFWMPVSAMLHVAQREPFLNAAQRALERKSHHRKLPRALVPDFLAWVDTSWSWCEEHGVGLDKLQVRLDGGAKRGMGRPGSTRVELWRGFGVMVSRGPAFSGNTAKEGMRWVRVNIASDDPLRDLFNARPGSQGLDLLSALPTPEPL